MLLNDGLMMFLRTVCFFPVFWLTLLLSVLLIPYFAVLGVLTKEGQRRFVAKSSRIWAKNLLRIVGARVTVHGIENIAREKNVLFVSNHQSTFDILILLAHLPGCKGFISKYTVKLVPLLGFWAAAMGTVFIKRYRPRQILQELGRAAERIKQGCPLILFPEGTSSKGPEMLPFKKGSLKVAIKSEAVIIPITISGSYKLYEGNNKRIGAGKVDVSIHSPVRTGALSDRERENLEKLLESIIQSKLAPRCPPEKHRLC